MMEFIYDEAGRNLFGIDFEASMCGRRKLTVDKVITYDVGINDDHFLPSRNIAESSSCVR